MLFFQVTHSRRVNKKLLEAWIIVYDDGTVQLAHCLCNVGLSEGCSHIAAIHCNSANFIPKTITGQYDPALQLASYQDVLSYCATLDTSVTTEQVCVKPDTTTDNEPSMVQDATRPQTFMQHATHQLKNHQFHY